MNPAVPLSSARPLWRECLRLCKPTIVAMIVFTAWVGMFMAAPGLVKLSTLLSASLGIALAAASAAVGNHIVDRRIDGQMGRTRGRPLPQGRVSLPQASCLAVLMGVSSFALLALYVNPLTAVLTILSLVGYGFVYSMWLKHKTPQNIVIGGAAGAAPPVLGWSAVTGTVEPHALLLFLIVFVWTPPHFWALALHRLEEYRKAEIPMLPVTHGVACTRIHIMLYTVLTVIASILPVLFYLSGFLYLLAATLLNIRFVYIATRLCVLKDDSAAMPLFVYSIRYLVLLFAALLVDHHMLWWPWGGGALPY